jgi:phage terminase large subunit-like protein
MPLDLSCRDWRERLAAGRVLVPELELDTQEADRAVAIFNRLRLADVPGNPRLEDAGADWFRAIVRALFGSLDRASRERAIRELFVLVPKKNSKTTNGALLMLTALLMNQRPRAPFIMTAPVQDVSELAFGAAAGAIALDPVLQKKLHVKEHIKTIVHRETLAELQIMTFDPAVLTGQRCAGALIDELHVVSRMSKAPSAIRQLRGGMLPFPEAFLAFITTQSEEAPTGVFRAELERARAIRDGTASGAMLPVLYEFPREIQQDGEAWRDPKRWGEVLPNAGRSVSIPRLVEELATAEAAGADELRAWASQHLNVEIGVALHSQRWIGADFWEDAGEALTLEDILERSEVITIGIDGGGLADMLGLCILGREKQTARWLQWSHAWIHPAALERYKQEQQRWIDFERAGELTIVDEIGADVAQVADYCEQCEEAGLLERIGVDQAGIGAIVDEITGRRIALDRIVGIPQGWKLVGAIKTTERKLAERALVHGRSSLMAWSVGNARVEPRGNAIAITKALSGNAKIDTLMATFDAVALMSMNPKPKKKRFQFFVAGTGERAQP